MRTGVHAALVALWLVVLSLTRAHAAADSATLLDHYLQGLTSLHTAFTQSVTDARGQAVESGAGTLIVQRPGKFRWDYMPHSAGSKGGELLVADGRNLWYYDRELSQVSVKPEDISLSATPMMLLSGASADLRGSFDITAGDARDGLEWVEVLPHGTDGDFSKAELGFKAGQLQRMIVNDRLGQTVRLDFNSSVRNGHINAADLQFAPPPGVDVIGKPES